jgi:hypothetical protein
MYCKYCQEETLSTYRDNRNHLLNTNLVNCCHSCAKTRDYLNISSIFKPDPLEEKHENENIRKDNQ